MAEYSVDQAAADAPRLLALPSGRPTIADDAWIAPGATVVGAVTVGSGTAHRLGFPLTLGDGISVGHRAVLHGWTVGDDTLVGMGAVVLNGARIGERCLITASALVLEGAEIPAGSLVAGTPEVAQEIVGEHPPARTGVERGAAIRRRAPGGADPVSVILTDVVLRDGMQDEPYVLSTEDKLAVAEVLVAAGLPELEIVSFVHPKRVPQMADAEKLLAQFPRRPGVRVSAIALNLRGAQRAAATELDELRLVVSASAGHSQANSGRGVDQALDEVAATVSDLPDLLVVGAVATAFVSQDEGRIPPERLVSMVRRFHAAGIRTVGLADTLGTASPEQVVESVGMVREAMPDLEIALHLHDPYGAVLPTVDAAYDLGIRRFDSALAGFGGCPAIPDPHGNMATESVVHHLHQRGIDTGVDEEALSEAIRPLNAAVARATPLAAGGFQDREPVP